MFKKLLFMLFSFVICVCVFSVRAAAYDAAVVGEYRKVSMGMGHTAMIKSDNSLWVWGSNTEGQVGNGGKTDAKNVDLAYKENPVKIMDDVVSVSCGANHTAVLKWDGSLYMWGSNSYGQLGNGGKGNSTDPYGKAIQTTPVKILDGVSAVCCGDEATAAIKSDGSLWVWGKELGNSPKKVLSGVRAFSFYGKNYNAVIMNDNSLWYWGEGCIYVDFYGLKAARYGDVTKRIKIADNVRTAYCSVGSVAYLKEDGTVWIFGSNETGQYGNGKVNSNSSDKVEGEYIGITKDLKPVQVKGLEDIVSLSYGGRFDYIAALRTDGSLWLWGSNFLGQIGNGYKGKDYGGYVFLVQTKPQRIMKGVKEVFCGEGSTAAIKEDGSLWMWGDNSYGKLGIKGGDIQMTLGMGTSSSGAVFSLTWWCVLTPRQAERISLQADTKAWRSTVKAVVKGNDVTVSWGKADEAKSYTVYKFANGKYTKLLDTKKTSVVLKSMKAGKEYRIVVKYKLKNGEYSSDKDSGKLIISP